MYTTELRQIQCNNQREIKKYIVNSLRLDADLFLLFNSIYNNRNWVVDVLVGRRDSY